jgi:hypothetical protein
LENLFIFKFFSKVSSKVFSKVLSKISFHIKILQMGQPLPLPEKIPRPNLESENGRKLMNELKQVGITLEDSTEAYVRYTLPEGWKMVDDSWREDLPRFYILDQKDMMHFSIQGSWKGTYDNELTLTKVPTPAFFQPQNRDKPLIPSETSTGAVLGSLGEVLDPLHRPPTTLCAQRQKDYSS